MRLLALTVLFLGYPAWAADVAGLVGSLMSEQGQLENVPFREVVRAATGKQVLPLNSSNAVDRELMGKISSAMDRVLRQLNTTNGPAQRKRRINEVSALFEDAMKTELNAIEGFACDFPKTASGIRQRAGYPDLRLADRKSGRIVYLDPKLFERGSRASSLRTFYYEPKRQTNKILEDAHHLLVGFQHDGRENGAWTFLGWELVDLAHFHVRLKAEFQGSNRDLHRPEAIVGSSTNAKARAP